MKMPLGTGVGLGSGDIVLDGDPAPPLKAAQQLSVGELGAFTFRAISFRHMSVVAKRSPVSAAAELLFDHSLLFRMIV